MNFKVIAFTAMFLLVGCDSKNLVSISEEAAVKAGVADSYPETKNGIKAVKGTLLTEVLIKDAATGTPAMFWISNECKVLSTATKYGKESLEFKPNSISCVLPSGESIERRLNSTDISSAFVNAAFPADQASVFQIYNSEVASLITTRE